MTTDAEYLAADARLTATIDAMSDDEKRRAAECFRISGLTLAEMEAGLRSLADVAAKLPPMPPIPDPSISRFTAVLEAAHNLQEALLRPRS